MFSKIFSKFKQFLLPWVKNRYWLAFLFTVTWMLFFDRYDWISQAKFYLEIHSMQKDKDFYLKEIERLKAE